ncbi:hypothetical protein L211DRAFT_226206 [Terfezia boudieri ATCC MYA-4762]|uniref:Uncharacterized protein n=1 Tax=Terfezia boudieri ATCC MYA-4762 TaxID=1051890 RepID=A0A3N4LRJ8_9PEZI|nr:hypothetical protein L211DRAFT_226206 [Terfezia boudieri ATCC MYA-4762]
MSCQPSRLVTRIGRGYLVLDRRILEFFFFFFFFFFVRPGGRGYEVRNLGIIGEGDSLLILLTAEYRYWLYRYRYAPILVL